MLSNDQESVSPAQKEEEEEAAGFLQRAKDALLSSEDLQRWQSVASSIQDCMQHVGPWGLGDFAFGLCVISPSVPRSSTSLRRCERPRFIPCRIVEFHMPLKQLVTAMGALRRQRQDRKFLFAPNGTEQTTPAGGRLHSSKQRRVLRMPSTASR